MLKKYPMLTSLLSSFLLFAYVFLVSLLMNNGEKLFGKGPEIFAALFVLLLFVFSALVCGLLLLGGPIYLYLEKNKKEALKMLLSNIIFLGVILLITISLNIIF